MSDGIDRRQFLQNAGRFALVAGLGGVLVSLEGCGGGKKSAHPGTTVPASPTLPGTTGSATTAASTTVGPLDWSQLAGMLKGQLVLPTNARYATARQEFNPRFDTVAPMAIAYCASSDDVARCLSFARQHGVPLVPRSGGHSYEGWSTGTGLVIDVSPLNSVVIDAASGSVTVGAGTKLVDLYATLAAAGLGLSGGSCPTVGIAGLTLGGGIGVVDRKYGLTCDALTSLDMVTADSRALTCSPAANTDLWWASRGGGGGSFGIVTSFTFTPHPVGPIALFTLDWPWSAAADVVAAWQEWGPTTPDELWANCQLLASGGGGVPRLKVTGVYLGSTTALSNQLAPLTKAVGTAPSSRFVGPETYARAMMIEAGCSNDSVAQCHLAAPGTAGVLTRSPFSAKSDFLTTALPAPGVAAVVASVLARQQMSTPGGGAITYDLAGGAINQVPADATAFVHRDTMFSAQYSASWGNGASAATVASSQAWLRQAWADQRPYVSGQAYQNYVDPDLVGWEQAYYGANLARLTRIKAAVDPDDVFHSPQSIPLP